MSYEGPHPFPVKSGGTGDASFTEFAPVCGGTSTTGALQVASTGMSTSGNVLTSNGSSALPSFKPPAGGPGGAQAWGVVTVSGGSSTLINSFNVTSTSGGPFPTITLSSGFSNANYSVVVSSNNGSQPAFVSSVISSTQFSIGLGSGGSGTLYFACFGN
jgi:hypothetical protein